MKAATFFVVLCIAGVCHTYVQAESAAGGGGVKLWEFISKDNSYTNKPLIGKRNIFLTSLNKVIAINMRSGAQTWSKAISNAYAYKNLCQPILSVDMKSVFVGPSVGRAGSIFALDSGTGVIQWQSKTKFDVSFGALTSTPDGKVLLVATQASGAGGVYALDTSTGALLWVLKDQVFRRAGFTGPLPVTSDSKTVFAINFGTKGHLYAVDVKSGKTKWRIDTNLRTSSGLSLSPDEKTVYWSENGADTETGARRWNKTYPEFYGGPDSLLISQNGKMLYTAADTHTSIYPNWYSIITYSASSGKRLWVAGQGGTTFESIASNKKGTMLFKGGSDGHVICVNATTGHIIWTSPQYQRDFFGYGKPILSKKERKLYTISGGKQPKLLALDAATGKEAWRVVTGGNFSYTVFPGLTLSPDGTQLFMVTSPAESADPPVWTLTAVSTDSS